MMEQNASSLTMFTSEENKIVEITVRADFCSWSINDTHLYFLSFNAT